MQGEFATWVPKHTKSRNETHEQHGEGKASWKEEHPNATQGQLARWAPKHTKSGNETHEEP